VEAAVSLGAMPIYRYGTDEQKRLWLPRLCSGEMLGAFGLTEPRGGSDVAGAIRTTARLVQGDGDAGAEWAINGVKAFITNAGTDITGVVAVVGSATQASPLPGRTGGTGPTWRPAGGAAMVVGFLPRPDRASLRHGAAVVAARRAS
jgi:alkylation response protein AidB-like acyl-CoA dehydrogenase